MRTAKLLQIEAFFHVPTNAVVCILIHWFCISAMPDRDLAHSILTGSLGGRPMTIQTSLVNLMLMTFTKHAEVHLSNPREYMQRSIILHRASWRTHISAHETHEKLFCRAHIHVQPMEILGFWSGFDVSFCRIRKLSYIVLWCPALSCVPDFCRTNPCETRLQRLAEDAVNERKVGKLETYPGIVYALRVQMSISEYSVLELLQSPK